MGVCIEPPTKQIYSNTPVFIEYDLNTNINQIYNPHFARLLTTDIEILKENDSQEEYYEHEELESEEDQELPHLVVSI